MQDEKKSGEESTGAGESNQRSYGDTKTSNPGTPTSQPVPGSQDEEVQSLESDPELAKSAEPTE